VDNELANSLRLAKEPKMPEIVMFADLFYKEGSSDKVYKVSVEKADTATISGGKESLFVVNYGYGRRGSALKYGSKTSSPVSLDKATAIYNNLISEKTAKGYQHTSQQGESGGKNGSRSRLPSIDAEEAKRKAPKNCVLLNPIDSEEAERLLSDDEWAMQAKVDGIRLMIEITDGKAFGYNRRGIQIPLPSGIESSLADLEGSFLDGELVGENFHAFDEVLAMEFHQRFAGLRSKLKESACIRIVETAWATKEKRGLHKKLQQANAEGVVFKRKSALYTSGRPASGGNYLKHKFVQSATCVVTGINDKRSVSLAVSASPSKKMGKSAAKRIAVGNVTIPSNQSIPEVGDIVEVRYLYYFANGSLFQPVYLGVREDLDATEIDLVGDLKLKADSEDR